MCFCRTRTGEIALRMCIRRRRGNSGSGGHGFCLGTRTWCSLCLCWRCRRAWGRLNCLVGRAGAGWIYCFTVYLWGRRLFAHSQEQPLQDIGGVKKNEYIHSRRHHHSRRDPTAPPTQPSKRAAHTALFTARHQPAPQLHAHHLRSRPPRRRRAL